MPAIEMQGNNWFASAIVSENPTPDGIFHVTVKTNGETRDDAMNGAVFVMNVFARGRTAFLRSNPEVNSDTDFDTKQTRHQGFARFSFKFEAGEWQVVAPPPHISLGSAA